MPFDEKADNSRKYGIYAQRGTATPFPELKKQLRELLLNKVAPLPWLPSGWADAVRSLDAQYPDAIIKATPASSADLPTWLDTDQKRKWWGELADTTARIAKLYILNQYNEAKAAREAAESNVEFWNSAYDFTKAINDVPVNIVNATGDVATGVALTAIKKLWIPALLVAGVFILYTNRSLFAKAAGKKIVGG